MNIKATLGAAVVMAAAGAAWAQPDIKASPLEAATASKADQPVTVSKAGQTMTSDADILRLVKMLTGSFASEAKGETPALRFNAAAVEVGGLDNAVLFEVARADNPAEPFRVGIMHAYRRKGDLRLRLLDFGANQGVKDMLASVWAVPEVFPKTDVSALTPNVDMPLKIEGDAGFSGETTQPAPTTRDGAIEMTSSIRTGKDSLAFGDAGFDADGKQVWGTTGGIRVVFKRLETSSVSVRRGEGGLIVLTTVPPEKEAEKLIDGGEVTAHYTGWLSTGLQFDTSHKGADEPFRLRIPGGVIRGWNEGLKEIAKGERRRLFVPSEMGFGAQGRPPVIPPNASLVFDVECLHIDNAAARPPAITPPPTPPAPTPHAPQPNPPTATPQSDAPIGTPSSGGVPEKPR